MVPGNGQLTHVILWAFDNHDRNDHRTLLGAVPADIFDFHVDVAVVLVKLAQFVQVLFQLYHIQAPRFIHEVNGRPPARFHLFAQYLFTKVGISFEMDLAYRSFRPFVNGENNTRCAALLVNWINAKLHADIIESVPLINVDDFLARFLQLLFADRLVESHFDFFAQPFCFDPFGSGNFDLANDRPRLHRHDHLHAIAFRLSKNANVLNGASLIERFDILFDHLVGIGLANLSAHVRQNPFLADRFGPCVLHLDGTDHGRPRRRLRSLCPNDYGASQRTDGSDPNCKR